MKTEGRVHLHATLPFGIGTTKLGFVEAVHTLPTILLVVATFTNSTPPRAIPKWPESFPLHKTRWLLDLGDLWIRQAWAV